MKTIPFLLTLLLLLSTPLLRADPVFVQVGAPSQLAPLRTTSFDHLIPTTAPLLVTRAPSPVAFSKLVHTSQLPLVAKCTPVIASR